MKIEIYDTTLRDGTQAVEVAFTVEDKLRIARELDRLGFDYIEGGWPGSNERDKDFFERAKKDLKLEHARLTAFGSTRHYKNACENDANIRALVDSGVDAVAIFGKSWDAHVEKALGISLEENLELITSSVDYLKKRIGFVIYDAEHFFDGFKRSPQYALSTLKAAEDGGADRIVLCDTNGGCDPLQIMEIIVRSVSAAVKTPLGIHCHNDSGMAVANSMAAVFAGITHVQGTINGFGERTGNADLIQIIPNLQIKKGYNCIHDNGPRELTLLSRLVYELANLQPNRRQPFVGDHSFAHKGGIHVSAVKKDPALYEQMDPQLVGNRRGVVVSDLAGKSNLEYKVRELKLPQLTNEQMGRVIAAVKELENLGYSYEGAEDSLKLLVIKEAGVYAPFFELVGVEVSQEKKAEDDKAKVTASVALKVMGREKPVHMGVRGISDIYSIDRAIRSALSDDFKEIKQLELIDYKVRNLSAQKGEHMPLRAVGTFNYNGKIINTVGVGKNLIEASWQMLTDAYHILLYELSHGRIQTLKQKPGESGSAMDSIVNVWGWGNTPDGSKDKD